MGKDKGYSGEVMILGEGIFKHMETFQHLDNMEPTQIKVLPQRCRGGAESAKIL